MDFLGNDNKAILWSVLDESNIFQKFPNEKYNEIKHLFENVLNEYVNNNDLSTNKNIMDMNREVIPILLNKVNTLANSQPVNNKLQVVYRSEDLKKQKQEEMSLKMQEQKSNMDSLLQPKRPKEVSFADNRNNEEDKPIGDNMDRLIQEMLSSREKELDNAINTTTLEEAKKWIGIPNTSTNNTSTNNTSTNNIVKEPDFLEEDETEGNFVKLETVSISNNEETNNPISIVNKFKKRDIQQEILEELKIVKNNQQIILEKLNSALEK